MTAADESEVDAIETGSGASSPLGLAPSAPPAVPAPAPSAERTVTDFVETTGARSRRPLLRHGSWGLARSLTRQSIATRYRQSTLHLAWLVVQPLAFVGVYALFFHGVLNLGSGDVPYLSFIVAGIVPWRFISNGLGNPTAITDNIHLISKVYFPREIIPLVSVGTGVVDLAIGTVIMLVVAAVQGNPPTYHLVALPLAYLLLIVVTAALTVFVCTVAVFIRDLGHAMPLVLIGVFFATPIMYTTSQLPSWLQWFPKVNPFAVVISEVRDVVLYQQWFPPTAYLVHLLFAVCLFVASLAYVRSVEARMVDLA